MLSALQILRADTFFAAHSCRLRRLAFGGMSLALRILYQHCAMLYLNTRSGYRIDIEKDKSTVSESVISVSIAHPRHHHPSTSRCLTSIQMCADAKKVDVRRDLREP